MTVRETANTHLLEIVNTFSPGPQQAGVPGSVWGQHKLEPRMSPECNAMTCAGLKGCGFILSMRSWPNGLTTMLIRVLTTAFGGVVWVGQAKEAFID